MTSASGANESIFAVRRREAQRLWHQGHAPTTPVEASDLVVADGLGRLTLTDVLGRGGEGVVRAVAGCDTVAKIYAKVSLQAERKVLDMLAVGRRSPIASSAWPADILRDPRTGAFVGFLMPRIGGRDIHDLYAPVSRKRMFPSADWSFLVMAAENLAVCFASLHAAGVAIGDVNHSNFRVDDDAIVTAIDCDSMVVTNGTSSHPCRAMTPEFTPPEVTGPESTRGPEQDAFGLAVLVFHLLFLGRHPFAGVPRADVDVSLEGAIRNRWYPYASASPPALSRPPVGVGPEIAGPVLSGMFERSFTASPDRRPSAPEWLHAIRTLRGDLVTCAVVPSHRHVMGPACPWCALDAVSGGDSFPSVGPTIFPASTVGVPIVLANPFAASAAQLASFVDHIREVRRRLVTSPPMPPLARAVPQSRPPQVMQELDRRVAAVVRYEAAHQQMTSVLREAEAKAASLIRQLSEAEREAASMDDAVARAEREIVDAPPPPVRDRIRSARVMRLPTVVERRVVPLPIRMGIALAVGLLTGAFSHLYGSVFLPLAYLTGTVASLLAFAAVTLIDDVMVESANALSHRVREARARSLVEAADIEFDDLAVSHRVRASALDARLTDATARGASLRSTASRLSAELAPLLYSIEGMAPSLEVCRRSLSEATESLRAAIGQAKDHLASENAKSYPIRSDLHRLQQSIPRLESRRATTLAATPDLELRRDSLVAEWDAASAIFDSSLARLRSVAVETLIPARLATFRISESSVPQVGPVRIKLLADKGITTAADLTPMILEMWLPGFPSVYLKDLLIWRDRCERSITFDPTDLRCEPFRLEQVLRTANAGMSQITSCFDAQKAEWDLILDTLQKLDPEIRRLQVEAERLGYEVAVLMAPLDALRESIRKSSRILDPY